MSEGFVRHPETARRIEELTRKYGPLPPGWYPCAATTTKGKPCRRMVSEGWTYCGSHRHLRTPATDPIAFGVPAQRVEPLRCMHSRCGRLATMVVEMVDENNRFGQTHDCCSLHCRPKGSR